MSYATLADLKVYLNITDSVDDTNLTLALNAAESAIDNFCGRTFNLSSTATERTYRPVNANATLVYVDDIGTPAGLVVAVDTDKDGVYETTWTSSQFQLEPRGNGLEDATPSNGTYPYTKVRAIAGSRFPYGYYGEYVVSITAKWGWPSVPADVKYATLIYAARLFKRKDSIDMVSGISEFGVTRFSRTDADVTNLLIPYRKRGYR